MSIPSSSPTSPTIPVFTFDLYTSLGQVHVFTSPGFPDLRKSLSIEDARVRMQGVFATIFNARRQLVGYQLELASPANIQVLEPAVADPFAMAAMPIGSLLRYSPGSRFGHRVKIAGVVTMAGTTSRTCRTKAAECRWVEMSAPSISASASKQSVIPLWLAATRLS